MVHGSMIPSTVMRLVSVLLFVWVPLYCMHSLWKYGWSSASLWSTSIKGFIGIIEFHYCVCKPDLTILSHYASRPDQKCCAWFFNTILLVVASFCSKPVQTTKHMNLIFLVWVLHLILFSYLGIDIIRTFFFLVKKELF